ncbi:MAG: hypothetical protein M0P50_15500, partial [Bacteroidales bacterium]|nr:hypothetical protein [Bacteroidales bacterium]
MSISFSLNSDMRFNILSHGFAAGGMGSLSGSIGQSAPAELQMIMAAALGGTAEALGGGKFANGAVTGAYVMMFNHLSTQIEVNKFQKKYFGHVKGLNKIHTDAIPDGYSLDQ